MAIDWDAELLAPLMAEMSEGVAGDPTTWPLYTPRGLPAFRLADAVFDSQYRTTDIVADDSAGASNASPILGVRQSLFLRPPAENDSVFIPATLMNGLPAPGRTFIVRNAQADGHGHTKLLLMETT